LKTKKPRKKKRRHQKLLRFTPYAWAKLQFLRDLGPTEIGGFGISSKDDLLLVEDVGLVKQTCDWASVQFDDDDIARFFDEGVDAGLQPEQFGRIWIHTHPGGCPLPSSTDEATFMRVFGGCDWSVMFILAKGGASYARLKFRAGPGGQIVLPVGVEFGAPFEGASPAEWQTEYATCVCGPFESDFLGFDPFDAWSAYDAYRWTLTHQDKEDTNLASIE
jgi:proteasome lid subunit RPN8/RPN11